MTTHTANDQPREEPGTAWSPVKRLLLASASVLIQATVLFISAGRLDWAMAWAYLVAYGATGMAITVFSDPGLIAERARIKEDAKSWDMMILTLSKLSIGLAMPLVAGLDMRLGWTQQMPLAVQLVALVFVALGYGLSSWATIVNKFFSDIIRIQADRGHTVVSHGPYQYVRHPGYIGMILFLLATPFLLDSLWVLIPGGFMALLIIVRTVVEDKTLLEELDGYQEYAARVRYRLLPGIW
jgi:protein-S-isoprenylcysteine O-methyltransferase Ste14